MVACDELLTADVERAEAPLRFATTEETFITEGWVPEGRADRIRDALEKAAGGRIYIEELEVDDDTAVPVEYENPTFAKPSQLLMDLYGRPRYSELDPTLLLAIVFPFFFGMILGDVGYGAVLLALSLGLRKFLTGEGGRMLLKVLSIASISSIIFGILYSEVFGFSLPWSALIFSRHLNIGEAAGGHGPQVVELMIVGSSTTSRGFSCAIPMTPAIRRTIPVTAETLNPMATTGRPVRLGIIGMGKNDQIRSRMPHMTASQPIWERIACVACFPW